MGIHCTYCGCGIDSDNHGGVCDDCLVLQDCGETLLSDADDLAAWGMHIVSDYSEFDDGDDDEDEPSV